MQKRTWSETSGSSRSGYQIHRVTATGSWGYPEHDHCGFCEFVYLLHGRLRQSVNGTDRIQQPGEIILIREQDAHALEGSGFAYVNIMFPVSWLMRFEIFSQVPGQTKRILKSIRPPAAIIPLAERHSFHGLMEELHAAHDQESGRQIFAHFLTLTLSRHIDPVADHEMPSDLPEWLQETVRWIHQHHDTVPVLADVISRSCRCQEHFTRQFSRHFGISPSRYLANLRIERAAGLLATTNLPVQEICYGLGFENESYFYRMFRNLKQMTPLAYRRKHGPRSIQPRTP